MLRPSVRAAEVLCGVKPSKAIPVGDLAASILASCRALRVKAIFENVIDLETDEGAIVGLQSPRVAHTPSSVLLDEVSFRAAVRLLAPLSNTAILGCPAAYSVDSGCWIDVEGFCEILCDSCGVSVVLRPFDCRLGSAEDGFTLASAKARRLLLGLMRACMRQGSLAAVVRNVGSANDDCSWKGDALETSDPVCFKARRCLTSAERALDADDVDGSARMLMELWGLGYGLTPSGDDFTLGVLAVASASGSPLLCQLKSALLECHGLTGLPTDSLPAISEGTCIIGRGQTGFSRIIGWHTRRLSRTSSWLSASLLTGAALGCFSLPVRRVLQARTQDELVRETCLAMQWGHTSGLDTLAGMYWALVQREREGI